MPPAANPRTSASPGATPRWFSSKRLVRRGDCAHGRQRKGGVDQAKRKQRRVLSNAETLLGQPPGRALHALQGVLLRLQGVQHHLRTGRILRDRRIHLRLLQHGPQPVPLLNEGGIRRVVLVDRVLQLVFHLRQTATGRLTLRVACFLLIVRQILLRRVQHHHGRGGEGLPEAGRPIVQTGKRGGRLFLHRPLSHAAQSRSVSGS